MTVIPTLKANIDFGDLQKLADTASQVVQNARTTMLSPTSTKTAPVFTTVELAQMIGVDRQKIAYAAKKGQIPQAMKVGSKLAWSLEDAQACARFFRPEMMRDPSKSAGVVVTVANFKGGVAKTTTAAALAQGLSLLGHKKILLIDLDGQGSLTTLNGFLPDTDVEEHQTFMSVCTGEQTSLMPAIQSTYWNGIDIVAAAPLIFSAEFLLPARQKQEPDFQFWRVLDNALEEARSVYDVIVIDTSPSLSYTTINAIMAADGILMPLPPSSLDFASSAQFWNLLTEVCGSIFKSTGDSKKFNFVNILLSRVDRSDMNALSVRQWINSAYGSMVLPVEIPRTAIAGTAAIEFGTVYDIDPDTVHAKTLKRARDAYDNLVRLMEVQIAGVWKSDLVSIQPK